MVGYVAQVNATALTARTTGSAVDVASIVISAEGESRSLLAEAPPRSVFEFWNETCGPCLRNLRDLGAYRDAYTVVPVYVPFFDAEPRDVSDYVDYPVAYQAVLASRWEEIGLDGVPLAVVVDGQREVCFQGILRDTPLDLVGGRWAILNVHC